MSDITQTRIIIGRAQCTDIPQILDIQSQSFADGHICSRQWRYLINKAKGMVVVAKDCSDKLVGYMVLLAPKHCKSCRIYTIAVAYDSRREGVGTALISFAKSTAPSFNKRKLHLEMRASSRSLSKFYQQLGFSVQHELPNYYGEGKDGIRLRVRLSSLVQE